MQFGLFQPFLGQFQHVGYQKACTQAEKFIGGTSRGHWPQKGPKAKKRPPTTALCKSYPFLRKVPKHSSMFESPVKYVLGVKRPLLRGIKITLNLLQNSGRLFQPYGRQTQFCPRI